MEVWSDDYCKGWEAGFKTGSAWDWQDIIEFLSEHHDITALGLPSGSRGNGPNKV